MLIVALPASHEPTDFESDAIAAFANRSVRRNVQINETVHGNARAARREEKIWAAIAALVTNRPNYYEAMETKLGQQVPKMRLPRSTLVHVPFFLDYVEL